MHGGMHRASTFEQFRPVDLAVGNGRVEFVPTTDSPRPDLRIRAHDGAPMYVEAYVPRVLVHPPRGHVSPEQAAGRVERALKRKKSQLQSGDSLLLIGGLGCGAETIEALRLAAVHELSRRDRPGLVGIGIFAPLVVTEYGGTPDAPVSTTVAQRLPERVRQEPSVPGAHSRGVKHAAWRCAASHRDRDGAAGPPTDPHLSPVDWRRCQRRQRRERRQSSK